MSLASQVSTLATRIGTEFKSVRAEVATLVGSLGGLTTTNKTNIVAALNEVNAKAVPAPPDATATEKGVVRLATPAETTTGTDTTRAVTPQGVAAAIAALVAAAPGTLDTLNELAAALGNDPNFATTITNSLAGKQPLDADLTALAALTSAANKLPYATGAGTWTLADITAAGRSLIAGADATAQRNTLSVYSQAQVGDPATDFVTVFQTALA